jgi:hypothetical protein
VVVTVVAVGVVQPAVDEIIVVVAVRHLLVTAALVLAPTRHRGTVGGVGRTDGQDVLVIMAVVRRMQMAVVQIIDVAVVLDAGVAAVFVVNVAMIVMDVVAHGSFSLEWGYTSYRLSTDIAFAPNAIFSVFPVSHEPITRIDL